uniref:DNA polymerase delta subunit 3 n=1 Tax=Caenorhabditis japonica TaxID=281687 RepID=A0A8R1I1R2_CAEJA
MDSFSELHLIIEKYVKSKGDSVWSLYEISGTVSSSDEFPFFTSDQKVFKHVVVPESELENAESKFEKVTSKRLHSVQRTNPNDTRVYGRSWANNDDLQGKSLRAQEAQKKKFTETTTMEVKKEKSATPEPKKETEKPVENAAKKTIVQPKKQTSVMSMFAKKTTKNTEKSNESENKNTRKRPKIEIDEEEVVPRKTEKKSLFDQSEDDDKFPSSREQTPEKDHSPPAKKSKKVVNDENRKAKTKLVGREMEPEENAKETVSPKSEERHRTTRIEKVVETFVDEDGYLVSKETQKAVECSPSPEKPKLKKVITAPIPGTSKPAKKGATITSFFKKA